MTGFERPQYLEEQLRAIQAQTVKSHEIMLWYNKGCVPQRAPLAGVRTVSCDTNFKFHGRFALALLAQTEYVAIFDDDTIPGPDWYASCLETMKTHEGILGTAGIRLTQACYDGYERVGWNGLQSNTPQEVDLVGHAWFFKREHLQHLWREHPISWENGEDIMFSALAQKYGGIKTFVPPHTERNKSAWGSTKGAQYGNDAAASYLKPDTNFFGVRNMVVGRAVKEGWEPIYLKNAPKPKVKPKTKAKGKSK